MTDSPIQQVKKRGLDAKAKLYKDLQEKLEESKKLQGQAQYLRQKADEINDPVEADKLRAEAGELEEKAIKLIRMAQRMQNGFFQGGAAGAGIGAGIAGGLGTIVGSLVGGVTAIPTTALGLLVGAGVGGVHGPWVKLVEETTKEEDEAEK